MMFLLVLVLSSCISISPSNLRPLPMGIENEDIPIEFRLSNQLYDAESDKDWVELHDSRITPKRFRGIYLRTIWQDPLGSEEVEYVNIEHLPSVRVRVIRAGYVDIIDPLEKLLQLAVTKQIHRRETQTDIVVYVK